MQITTKYKIRFLIFFVLASIFYLVFFASTFFFDTVLVSVISFLGLFLLLYFLAIDLYHFKRRWIRLWFFVATLVECIILWGSTWHFYLCVFLFNLAILILVLFLLYHLKVRSTFSSFAYFSEGGYVIAALLTIFFSVLLMGKYSEIPFTCDDIEDFPGNIVENQVNKMTTLKDRIKSWFVSDDSKEDLLTKEQFIKDVPQIRPVQKEEVETKTKTGIGGFFQSIQNEVLSVQDSISKKTCEYSMEVLRKTQLADGLQVAVIVILYFILISVFKIILWVITILGFVIFMILKPFKLYRFEKSSTEKEEIL